MGSLLANFSWPFGDDDGMIAKSYAKSDGGVARSSNDFCRLNSVLKRGTTQSQGNTQLMDNGIR